ALTPPSPRVERGAGGVRSIVDPTQPSNLTQALPYGLLFLDTTLEEGDLRDGLGHEAAKPLHDAWANHRPANGVKRGLREWLALDFFKDVHRPMYENRPIHWPLSSAGRTFVAWVNIHRFDAQTLTVLLADHLRPTLTRMEGELTDLRAARDGGDKKASRDAEARVGRLVKAREELQAFMDEVVKCADAGADPTDAKCPAREQDARYAPDLDDGVMINSAALWSLLEPQWKDPKKWYKELATATGRKDYDWSHLAMRYWPTRVDAKCQQDPSLGVAHGCFWRYHPARAWAWELRLQDEIAPDFRIVEAPYRPGGRELGDEGDGPHRDAWLRDHAEEALAAVEKEAVRRMGRGGRRKVVEVMPVLECGLWSKLPRAVWGAELRLAEKQGAELRIVDPDEWQARAAFEAANPDLVDARMELLATLTPFVLVDDDEDEDGVAEDREEVDGEEEDE
ncbi:MAG: SAM-dependent methyltransferase, partial [Myxococcales bacterium]|nr:SAM-dependent methyltransferase [Myxococcales bacterium]